MSTGRQVVESADPGVVAAQEAGRVVLQGELDISTADEVAAAVRRARVRTIPLAVDLRNVTFADSYGLTSILDASAPELRVVLEGPSSLVRRLLAVTDLGDLVDVRDTRPV